MGTFERYPSDTITLSDGLVLSGDVALLIADTTAASDARSLSLAYGRTPGDSATVTDGLKEERTLGAGGSDTIVITDGTSRAWTALRPLSDSAVVTDVLVRAANSVRGLSDALTVSDGVVGVIDIPTFDDWIKTKYVYLRHVNGYPSIVIDAHSEERNRLGTDIVLRKGGEVRFPATAFSHLYKGSLINIAHFMDLGMVTAAEDYLGTSRQLTAEEIMNYPEYGRSWLEWVLHRTVTTDDHTHDPTVGIVGINALDEESLLAYVDFDGGTTPDCTITPWYRIVTPTTREAWTEGTAVPNVTEGMELAIPSNYREVWLKVTSITGAPTSASLYLSGAMA